MRRILLSFLAVIIGAIPILFVAAIGVAAIVLPPRGPERSQWVPLVDLSDLPTDGTPELIPVVAPQYDGWIRNEDRPVDGVLVRRTKEGVKVLIARHHLGATAYDDPHSRIYRSPCWVVTFDLDGKVIDPRYAHTYAALRPVATRIEHGTVFVRADDPWGK
jgi:hypothetical protein